MDLRILKGMGLSEERAEEKIRNKKTSLQIKKHAADCLPSRCSLLLCRWCLFSCHLAAVSLLARCCVFEIWLLSRCFLAAGSLLCRWYFAAGSLLCRWYFAAVSLLCRWYFAAVSLLARCYAVDISLLSRCCLAAMPLIFRCYLAAVWTRALGTLRHHVSSYNSYVVIEIVQRYC